MIDFFKVILNIITKKEVYGVIVTLAIAYFIYKTATIILDEVINYGKNNYEKKKRRTVTNLFQNIIKYFILIVAALIILSIYGINVGAMIASLGIAATIIGLALQDTFKDIINGISIITENYFIVGDIVKYNTFTGEVIEFGLKSTKLKNANGEVLVIANRNILEVTNLSQKEQAVMINIPLPYEQPVEKIEKIIKSQILPQFQKIENVNKDSVKYLGVNELADSCIKYLVQFNCKRDTHWQAKRDANKIILTTLAKNKVSIPYPQLEVHYEK
ncbi:MAG: mechanosensitive ion channel family protein [Candidatus Coprovivens sp.]